MQNCVQQKESHKTCNLFINKTMAKKLVQAYRQAPWRKQLQSLGLYVLPLVGIALVAAIHLIVAAQSAEAGLKIYSLRSKEEELQRIIANQRTQLAWLMSYQRMVDQAKELDFVLVEDSQIHYVVLPAYSGRKFELLAPLPESNDAASVYLNAAYRQSLWDWVVNTYFNAEVGSQGVAP